MNVKRLLLSLTQALLIPAIAGLNALSNQAYAQTLSQQEAENAIIQVVQHLSQNIPVSQVQAT